MPEINMPPSMLIKGTPGPGVPKNNVRFFVSYLYTWQIIALLTFAFMMTARALEIGVFWLLKMWAHVVLRHPWPRGAPKQHVRARDG